MFSNDTNIETIGQLVEALKRYASLQGEYIKLNLVDKIVRLLTVAAISAIIVVLLMLIVIYLSFALAYWISPLLGLAGAFALVSGGYLLLLALCLIFRKQWIEKPLVQFLASILMEK